MLCASRTPGGKDGLGQIERMMPPAELLARAFDLVLAEWRAMGGGSPGLARRAVADDGAAGDE
jgi:hypothetical protein